MNKGIYIVYRRYIHWLLYFELYYALGIILNILPHLILNISIKCKGDLPLIKSLEHRSKEHLNCLLFYHILKCFLLMSIYKQLDVVGIFR